MAYSSTNWRDKLEYYSGSQSGTRSWGVLGQAQFQGRYYLTYFFGYNPFFGDFRKSTQLAGCGGGNSAAKLPNSGSTFNNYIVYTVQFCGGNFQQNYLGSTPNFVNWAEGDNTKDLGTVFTTFSGGYCGQYIEEAPGNITSVFASNFSNPNAFYSYTPWGGPPYFAGSNIAIPANDANARPYQLWYTYSTQC